MTDSEAGQVMKILFAAFPYACEKTPPETVELYIAFLSCVPAEIGKAAALKVVNHCEFFPTIAKLKEVINNFAPDSSGPPEAELAWDEVRKQLDPYNDKIKWSHPAIERAVRTIGFRNLCDSRTPGQDMARFMKLYDTYRQRELDRVENAAIMQLTGAVTQLLPGIEKKVNARSEAG